MGIIIATCGHEILSLYDEYFIATKEKAFDFDSDKILNAVSYRTCCRECLKFYRKENLVLDTQEEIDKWLKGDSHD